MSRRKKKRYSDNLQASNILEIYKEGYTQLRTYWRSKYFKNTYPMSLELGCGKGEHVLALARHFPRQNFVGIDKKGARLWAGSQQALREGLTNVLFLRAAVEDLPKFFDYAQIQTIYLPFPDPYPKDRHIRRRLTSATHLLLYAKYLSREGSIIFKTDSLALHHYTLEQLSIVSARIVEISTDYHKFSTKDPFIQSIASTYEQRAVAQKKTIKYIRFQLPTSSTGMGQTKF